MRGLYLQSWTQSCFNRSGPVNALSPFKTLPPKNRLLSSFDTLGPAVEWTLLPTGTFTDVPVDLESPGASDVSATQRVAFISAWLGPMFCNCDQHCSPVPQRPGCTVQHLQLRAARDIRGEHTGGR